MNQSDKTKPTGKAIELPEADDNAFPTSEDIAGARELAKRVSPTLLAMFDAKTYEPEESDDGQ